MHYSGSDNAVLPREENTSKTTRNTEKDDCFPLSAADANYDEHSTAMSLCGN